MWIVPWGFGLEGCLLRKKVLTGFRATTDREALATTDRAKKEDPHWVQATRLPENVKSWEVKLRIQSARIWEGEDGSPSPRTRAATFA